jgi:hypothetical protein
MLTNNDFFISRFWISLINKVIEHERITKCLNLKGSAYEAKYSFASVLLHALLSGKVMLILTRPMYPYLTLLQNIKAATLL